METKPYKSQGQFARAIGISESLLSRILSGERSPSKVVARKLAIATGFPEKFWLYSEAKDIKREVFKYLVEEGNLGGRPSTKRQ